MELILVRIFLYLEWIRRFMEYIFVFSPNTGKYGPEITPYLNTFHAASDPSNKKKMNGYSFQQLLPQNLS